MKALRAAGELSDVLSDFPRATRHYEESLEIARRIDDRRGIADALWGLAHEAERVGEHTGARPLLEESVAILRELGDEPSLARSLGGLAWLENDLRRARVLWQERVAIGRRLANRESVGWALINLGFSASGEGDYPAAREAFDEALGIARELGYKRMIARALTQLGDVALTLMTLPRPVSTTTKASRSGVRSVTAQAWSTPSAASASSLGWRETAPAAATYLEESLSVCREIGAREGEALALDSLGTLARGRGCPRRRRAPARRGARDCGESSTTRPAWPPPSRG